MSKSLQPDVPYIWYFKIRLSDLTEFMNLKYLSSAILGLMISGRIRKLEFEEKTQFLWNVFYNLNMQ